MSINPILINRTELNFTDLIKYPMGSILQIKESKNSLYEETVTTIFISDFKYIPDKCICILHSFTNNLSRKEITFLDCYYEEEENNKGIIKTLEIKDEKCLDKIKAFSCYTSYKNNINMTVKDITYEKLLKANVNKKFSATLAFLKNSENPYLIDEEVSAIVKYKNEKGVVVLFRYIKYGKEFCCSYWIRWIKFPD